jgi:hypothetical protein
VRVDEGEDEIGEQPHRHPATEQEFETGQGAPSSEPGAGRDGRGGKGEDADDKADEDEIEHDAPPLERASDLVTRGRKGTMRNEGRRRKGGVRA